MRVRNLVGLCLVILVAGACSAAHAATMIVNGDFEDTSGTFPNGWTVDSTSATQESTTTENQVISGNESLRVSGLSGNVEQTLDSGFSNFVWSFQWTRPFASFTSGQRSMNATLRQGSALPLINMRAQDIDGSTAALEVFQGTWQNPDGGATQVVLQPLTAYTITVTGSGFGTANASYDLSIVGGSLNESFSAVNLFHNAPTSGELADTVRFTRSTSHGTATYDNVSLVPVPEPQSLLLVSVLLGVGGVMRLRRRAD